MADIGDPIRREETVPLEEPVPQEIPVPSEEPIRLPALEPS